MEVRPPWQYDLCDYCAARSETSQLTTKWTVSSIDGTRKEATCGVHLHRTIHHYSDAGESCVVTPYRKGSPP